MNAVTVLCITVLLGSLGQIPCGVSAKIILTRTKPEIFLLADKGTYVCIDIFSSMK